MIINNLKTAFRTLTAHKAFSVITMAGLAIALASAQLIYIYATHEYTYDRFYPNAKNTYRVVTDFKFNDVLDHLALSAPPLGPSLKEYPEVNQVTQLTQYNQGKTLVKNGDKKVYLENIFFADSVFFSIFPNKVLEGDIHNALNTPNEVVLTSATARLFFSDGKAVGKTLQFDLNDGTFASYMVSAVVDDLPKNSHLKYAALTSMPGLWNIYPEPVRKSWFSAFMYTYITLRDGTDHKQFEAKLKNLFQKKTADSDNNGVKASCQFIVEPLTDIHLHSKRIWDISIPGNASYVNIFIITGLFILLIASINFINLTTARAAVRMKEMGIRKISGASRGQLMLQIMIEVGLISFLSLLLAFTISTLSLGFMASLTNIPFTLHDLFSVHVILVSIGLMIIVTLLSGLYPAYYLQRFQPAEIIKAGIIEVARQKSRAGFTLRRALVTFQFIISMVMIAATITIYRQLNYMLDKDPGFNRDHVVSVMLQDTLVAAKYQSVKAELLKLPAVEAVSFSQTIPGGPPDRKITRVEGSNSPELVEIPTQPIFMDFEYQQLMQFRLKEGQFIQADSGTGYRQAFLVNEAAVKKFGWKEALGKRIVFGFGPQNMRDGKVIGVVKDIQTGSFKEETEPMIFMAYKKPIAQTFVSVKLKGGELMPALRSMEKVFTAFDPVHPFDPVILDEQIRKLYDSEIRMSRLFTVFSSLTLFIACMGLLGLVSFITQQRTREIGIRKVMGAPVSSIVMLVSRDFLVLLGIAFVLAVPLAWYAMNAWLKDFATRIELQYDIFIITALLSVIVAWLSIGARTVRSASRNPVDSLRYE